MTRPEAQSNRVMIPRIGPALMVVVLLALSPEALDVQPAAAQAQPMPRVAGKYAATFQSVASNCSGVGMNLSTATVELLQAREGEFQVTLPSVPIMRGVVSRAGKFKAEAKRGKTAFAGVDGRFSVAGRVDDKGIQFLFIAEYYRGDKPMCTQSWNASGPKQ